MTVVVDPFSALKKRRPIGTFDNKRRPLLLLSETRSRSQRAAKCPQPWAEKGGFLEKNIRRPVLIILGCLTTLSGCPFHGKLQVQIVKVSRVTLETYCKAVLISHPDVQRCLLSPPRCLYMGCGGR